jgi:prepilin signal peptidase PulO-like enzyme (type II secretory pathway)
MTPLLFLLVSFFLFVIGTIIGSFLSVVILRSMRGESWVSGRSACDECGRQIRWFDNIPLISFILLKGRCRDCRRAIHPLHFLVELLTGILLVWWYWGGFLFFQLTQQPFALLQPLFWLLVGLILVTIFFTDFVYMIIPDEAIIFLTAITLLYRLMLVSYGIMQLSDVLLMLSATVAAFCLFYFLWHVTKGRGIGFGDVKLVIPLSLLLGWPESLVGIFLAFIIGAGAGLAMILVGKAKFKQAIPFGPFLIIGTIVSLLWGSQIFGWYLSLLS